MTSTASEVRWLTVAEVATKLNLSKMTVYRMISQKELPAYQFGRAFRDRGPT
jgi:excisionase family DNA binding protein